MGKGSTPSAPDPYTTAAAQYQYNTQSADYVSALDRINSTGPSGSVNYSVSGTDPTTGAPIYNQNTQLSQGQQGIYDAQQAGSQGLANLANTGIQNSATQLSDPLAFTSSLPQVQTQINTSGIPSIPGAGDLSGFTNQAQNASYNQQTQYLDPQYQQQQQQLQEQLANQGAHPGDPAYNNAMTLFNNQKQQAYSNAYDNSVTQGLNEQQGLYNIGAGANQQLYGQAATQANLANSAQQQAYMQGYQNTNLPINELNAIRSGSQVSSPTGQSLGTAGMGQVSAPNLEGDVQNSFNDQMSVYNAQQQGTNSLLGDAGTIAGAAMMFSDRRLKKNLRRIGVSRVGLPLYRFHYLWERDGEPQHVGVMAQDALHIPGAVVRHVTGYFMVNCKLVGV